MNKWEKVSLISLCSKIGDGLHGTPEYTDDSDIYFINGNNLKNGKIEIFEGSKKVSESELKDHYVDLDSNSLLLSINGTLGSLAFYNGEKVLLGKSAAYINFLTPINRFYYYYFQLPAIQQKLYNIATGSTIKNLSLKSIQDLEVPMPKDKEWNAIANVLSSLDSKIELNIKINAELEAMAKSIYDYWFVQFDFPISKEQAKAMGKPKLEGKPYKSSGGKMLWSEELKREVPEGWEVKELKSLIEIQRGISYTSSDIKGVGVPMINLNSFNLNGTYKAEGIKSYSGKYNERTTAKAGELLIAATDVTRNADIIGKAILVPDYYSEDLVYSMDIAKIIPSEKNMTSYLMMLFNSNHYHNYIKWYASGTLVLHLNIDGINRYKAEIPDQLLINKFHTFYASIFKRINQTTNQNQQLASLRDWLLPMLMNGQVKVGGTVISSSRPSAETKPERDASRTGKGKYKEEKETLNIAAEEKGNYKK